MGCHLLAPQKWSTHSLVDTHTHKQKRENYARYWNFFFPFFFSFRDCSRYRRIKFNSLHTANIIMNERARAWISYFLSAVWSVYLDQLCERVCAVYYLTHIQINVRDAPPILIVIFRFCITESNWNKSEVLWLKKNTKTHLDWTGHIRDNFEEFWWLATKFNLEQHALNTVISANF